jgi:hypothetical protein
MAKYKKYVAVRTQYYKHDAAIAELDHVHYKRNGFTSSVNVFSAYTKNNCGMYYQNAINPISAFKLMLEKYKLVTGKKARSDFNALFEHIVILSDQHYSLLEKQNGVDKAKKLIIQSLKIYIMQIKKEFGFEPFAIDLHLDEGHFDKLTGAFKRNVHAHIQFFNYDFTNKLAPLRHLMKKGKSKQGKTNELNPNFEKMQSVAAISFSKLGFVRGQSSAITGNQHAKKELFVKAKLEKVQDEVNSLEQKTALQKQKSEQYTLINQHKKKSIEQLDEEIEGKQKLISWFESQIEALKSIQNELLTAVKTKCRVSLYRISRSVSSLKVFDAQNKLKRRVK